MNILDEIAAKTRERIASQNKEIGPEKEQSSAISGSTEKAGDFLYL